MHQTIATRERGHWVVPVGAILGSEVKDCEMCGRGVTVLTVATADGPVVMEDDHRDHAHEDQTLCRDCRDA